MIKGQRRSALFPVCRPPKKRLFSALRRTGFDDLCHMQDCFASFLENLMHCQFVNHHLSQTGKKHTVQAPLRPKKITKKCGGVPGSEDRGPEVLFATRRHQRHAPSSGPCSRNLMSYACDAMYAARKDSHGEAMTENPNCGEARLHPVEKRRRNSQTNGKILH